MSERATPPGREVLARRYAALKSVQLLADEYGVRWHVARRWLREAGVPVQPKGTPLRLPAGVTLDPQVIGQAYTAGRSIAALARDHGCSPGVIRKVLESAKVELRRPAPKAPAQTGGQLRGTAVGRLGITRRALMRRLAAGQRPESIASALGVSERALRAAMHDDGITTPKRPRRPPVTWETAGVTPQQVRAALAAGSTATDLAALLRVGMTAMYRLLREAGIALPPPPRKRLTAKAAGVDVARLTAQWRSGASMTALATAYRHDARTLQRWMRRLAWIWTHDHWGGETRVPRCGSLWTRPSSLSASIACRGLSRGHLVLLHQLLLAGQDLARPPSIKTPPLAPQTPVEGVLARTAVVGPLHWPLRCSTCRRAGYGGQVATSPDESKRKLTRSERVAVGVLADIEAGRYKPGDRLPSMDSLAEAYGVGRSAVSVGLKVLREQGKVVSATSGIFVSGAEQPPMSASARLVKDIRDGIALGRLKPGDQLPREAELMKIYNLSSAAIRVALRQLRVEELIHSHGRYGRFVGPPGTIMRRQKTKSDTVAEEIASRIRQGDYRPGQYLPGEHALAQELGVSRKVVRSALASLRDLGLVATVVPKGTVVLEKDV